MRERKPLNFIRMNRIMCWWRFGYRHKPWKGYVFVKRGWHTSSCSGGISPLVSGLDYERLRALVFEVIQEREE